MPFRFERLAIPEVILIETTVFADRRGFFRELYSRPVFAGGGIDAAFVQDNHSRSVRRVLRGLHYQMHPRAQAKLVAVVEGEIFDVAVDIRKGSPTYGRWVSVVLSDRRHQALYVPVGFAHGFCVLSAKADVVYKVTAEYSPDLEQGIRWDDPELKIPWPVRNPLLSSRDAQLPSLVAADNNLTFEGTAR